MATCQSWSYCHGLDSIYHIFSDADITENARHIKQLKYTWVKAEHSTYLTALRSLDNFSPTSTVIGRCLFFCSFSNVPVSSLRSTCVPTNRKGVFWQWCVISGTHYIKQRRATKTQGRVLRIGNIWRWLNINNLSYLTN